MPDSYDELRVEQAPPQQMPVPSWIVTFADIMGLLLCFFVMLFIFSKQEEEKYKESVRSIQRAFGVKTSNPRSFMAPKPDETDAAILGQAERELMSTIQESIQASPGALDLQSIVIVDIENRGVVLRIYGESFFQPGTAQLYDNAAALLQPVLTALEMHNFNVLVRTNVTQAALNTAHFPSIWEFSAARSGAALAALAAAGIEPARLRAMGTGDIDIRVPPNHPKSEYYNNRTDFVFYLPGTEYW